MSHLVLSQILAHGFERLTYDTKNAISVGAFGVDVNNIPDVPPVLNLDFINCNELDPRFTFTRGSKATRVNNKGFIEIEPANEPRFDYDPVTLECRGLLIEDVRNSLLLYSEVLQSTAWTKQNAYVYPYAAIAPDGTRTAVKGCELAVNTAHIPFRQTRTTSVSKYTFSIYAKAAERSYFMILVASNAATVLSFDIDLTAKTASIRYQTLTGTAYVTDAGNGWSRCVVTYEDLTGGASSYVDVRMSATAVSTAKTGSTYLGVEGYGIYFWGALWEDGGFASSYFPSVETFTSRNSVGSYINSAGLLTVATSNVARYNYNPSDLTLAPKLLIEDLSTNLLLNSELLGTAPWSANLATVANNTATAPDGSNNASTVTITSFNGGVYQTATVNENTIYSFSVYAASGSISSTWLTFAFYNATAGAFIAVDVVPTALETVNGLTRFWAKVTTPAGCVSLRAYPFRATAALSSGTMRLWGAQLEASPFPTTYIPTVGSQVQRLADVTSSTVGYRSNDACILSGSSFNNVYNKNQFSLYSSFSISDFQKVTPLQIHRAVRIDDNTASNVTEIRAYSGSANLQFDALSNSSSVSQFDFTELPFNERNQVVKTAISVAPNYAIFSRNGSAAEIDTTVIMPQNCIRLYLGITNVHIREAKLFSKALSANQIVALSSQ